jgi:hypothetical protein
MFHGFAILFVLAHPMVLSELLLSLPQCNLRRETGPVSTCYMAAEIVDGKKTEGVD